MAISVDKYTSKSAKKGYLWRVRFTYSDIYGREHPFTKRGFSTKKEAEAFGMQKFKELQNTQLTTVQSVPLQQMWETYLELDSRKLGENTLKDYKSIYRNHLKDTLGQMPIQDISYIVLQKFFNERETLSANLNNKIKVVLDHCFKTALKAGVVTFNPVRDVEIGGKKYEKKEKYISLSEFHELEDLVKCAKRISEFQIQNRLMILRLGYYLGLRIGEIMGLRFSDIDWSNHTIHIQRQVIGYGGRSKLTDKMKTPASNAVLPICKTLYEYLVDWRESNPFEQIICTDNGEIMPRRTIENYFNTLKEGFHLHRLRHSFATNLYMAGVDQVTAASLTRHSSVEVLNNVYTHPQESKQKQAVDMAFGDSVISEIPKI